MLCLVLATTRAQVMKNFAAALSADPEVRLQQVTSGAAALEAVRASAPHLVIIDGHLPDTAPFDLVQELLLINAMVNTAVVSPLDDEEFHEASEGLGVLGRLPLEPGPGEAAQLLGKLRRLLGQGR
jgi:DNA-binding NarL/FixJ family response regulator